MGRSQAMVQPSMMQAKLQIRILNSACNELRIPIYQSELSDNINITFLVNSTCYPPYTCIFKTWGVRIYFTCSRYLFCILCRATHILHCSSLLGGRKRSWFTTTLCVSMPVVDNSCTSLSVSYMDRNSAIATHTNVVFDYKIRFSIWKVRSFQLYFTKSLYVCHGFVGTIWNQKTSFSKMVMYDNLLRVRVEKRYNSKLFKIFEYHWTTCIYWKLSG